MSPTPSPLLPNLEDLGLASGRLPNKGSVTGLLISPNGGLFVSATPSVAGQGSGDNDGNGDGVVIVKWEFDDAMDTNVSDGDEAGSASAEVLIDGSNVPFWSLEVQRRPGRLTVMSKAPDETSGKLPEESIAEEGARRAPCFAFDVLCGRSGSAPRLQGRLRRADGTCVVVHGHDQGPAQDTGGSGGVEEPPKPVGTVVALLLGGTCFSAVSNAIEFASDGALEAAKAPDVETARRWLSEGGRAPGRGPIEALLLDVPKDPSTWEQCREILTTFYGAAVVLSKAVQEDQMLRLDTWGWGSRSAAASAQEAATAVCELTGLGPSASLPLAPSSGVFSTMSHEDVAAVVAKRFSSPMQMTASMSIEQGPTPLVIGISGPTRSGKSTLAAELCGHFEEHGWYTSIFGGRRGLDTYFARYWITAPDHGANNWESPGALKHWAIHNDLEKALQRVSQHALDAGRSKALVIVEGFRSFWDPLLVKQMHVRFEVEVPAIVAEQRRVDTKGGEGIRPYFESHIWPSHRAYLHSAVARTPLVAFLEGEFGPACLLRQALSSPQLRSCLGIDPVLPRSNAVTAVSSVAAMASVSHVGSSGSGSGKALWKRALSGNFAAVLSETEGVSGRRSLIEGEVLATSEGQGVTQLLCSQHCIVS